ncbi:hypothetical protein D5R40_30860 [Okeania hirsuta]|uniref:Uncharacterized protein n=1 Tax=Okeania hirsuta TaxID=1458930 RepID=A0A3N6NXZ4_9CYAN|nr:hypothetical protein D5R40_30860 [Okeania hirsuta]
MTLFCLLTEDDFTRIRWTDFLGRTLPGFVLIQGNVETLDLSADKGGLKAHQAGGGMQTSSLRLEDNNEHQYTMRGIDKDATRTMLTPLMNPLPRT